MSTGGEAALYGWVVDTDAVAKNPGQHWADLKTQEIPPKGLVPVDRQRLRP
jgi:hypothetical protein